MTRTQCRVAIAAVLTGIGVFGVTRLLGGTGRTLTGQEAAVAAASVLGVAPAQMQSTGKPLRARSGVLRTNFVVNGEHIAVDALPAPGSFRVKWQDAETAPGHAGDKVQTPGVGIAAAQRTAGAIVARRFPGMSAMRLVIAERLAIGPYMLSWEQLDPGGAAVGNGARVFVNADTGRVLSYSERKRPQTTKLPPPRIAREEADRIARSLLETRVGKRHSLRLDSDKSGLVLSSAFSGDGGPVWELSYVDDTPPPLALSRLQFVAVDAVTGKDATNSVLPRTTGGGK